MKRTLIGLVSAALFSLSSNAFAAAQLDKSDASGIQKNGTIVLAQASGGNTGNGGATGGPAVTEPGEKLIGGKRKTETDTTTPAAPGATDTSGSSGAPDASQSKRKDTNEPAQSGSK